MRSAIDDDFENGIAPRNCGCILYFYRIAAALKDGIRGRADVQ